MLEGRKWPSLVWKTDSSRSVRAGAVVTPCAMLLAAVRAPRGALPGVWHLGTWMCVVRCACLGFGTCRASFLAEKVTSLGKDWHRPCLRCEKCNKTLTSGGHAEHDGKPYCNHPCYAALFGPKGFGRGGAESHTFK
uniref:LIM zinc-binding domain-containing protein n=1 Tax=Anas platyrhynchos TaxID=8839 RepID=A0A8B9THV9_ANAPL